MDGYLRATGVPVNVVAPNLNVGGLLSRLQPIQFGGAAPVQIQALAPWQIPTPKQYLPEGLVAAVSSIASGIDERTKRKQTEAEKKAEREFKAEESRLDREAKEKLHRLHAESQRELAEAKARVKASSVTERGESEASRLLPEGEAPQGEEPPLPAQGGGASLGLIDGTPQPKQVAPRGLSGIPDQSAAQAARGVDFGKIQDIGLGGSSIRLADGKTTVVGPLEDALARGPVEEDVVKAVPVTPQTAQGQPDVTGQQSGLLQGTQPPQAQPDSGVVKAEPLGPQKQAPYGRGPMNEPNLLPPELAKMPRYAVTYPLTFKDMDEYDTRKKWMDLDPRLKYTLPDNPEFNWNPKLQQWVIDRKSYISKESIAEKAREKQEKQKEKESKSIREAKEHAEKISLQEGRSIITHPSFKNFEGQSGGRPMTKNFINAYENLLRDPSQAGVIDLDLIDYYVRAATGGKPTEAQYHAVAMGKPWGEVLGLAIKDKPLTGAKLSQGQRDQMLRTMLENYNVSADQVNDVFDTVRQKMIKSGQTDDLHHPKDYVSNLILKKDAENKILQNKKTFLSLQEARKEAIRNNNKEDLNLIDEQMAEISKESDDLGKRLKKEKFSGSPILGVREFKHKKQGYVGGAGGFVDFGSLQSPAPQSSVQVNISPDNQ